MWFDTALRRIHESIGLGSGRRVHATTRQTPPRGNGQLLDERLPIRNLGDEFENNFIVIPQIETQVGVENVDAIVTHSLTTAVGLGPYDLSADLGCCWDPENANHKRSIATIKKSADAAGKKVWIGGDTVQLKREGYSFLWSGSVSSLLVKGLASTVDGLKEFT